MRCKLYLILLLTFPFKIYCQIPVRTNVQNKAIDNSAIPTYDSLSNFSKQKRSIDYLKFIGQELYLPPAKQVDELGIKILPYADILNLRYKEKREYVPDSVIVYNGYEIFYNSKADNKITTDLYNPLITLYVKGPYYDQSILLRKDVFNKTYLIIDITNQYNQKLRELQTESPERFLRFWLKTPNNDTIFFDKDMEFADKSLDPFLLMAYYNKNVEHYKKKDFFVFNINENSSNENKFIDINTGERIKLEYGDLWHCIDIPLIETEYSRTLSPFYILKNEANKEIKIPFGELIKNGLISFEELKYAYQIYLENEKNKELTQKRVQKEFKADCIKKFGSNYGAKIANGNLELGMSKEMILYGFGSPFKTLYSKNYQRTKEVFFYNNTVLYFQENKLIKILKYD